MTKDQIQNSMEMLTKSMNGLSMLVAIPLIVMSYHVFQFFESDPLVVRIGLALSFDILIVVLFYLINDELIKKNKAAIRACWICIVTLIAFQLYVNTWVYWGDVHPARAVISGAIFPLLVGPISYIASLRKAEETKVEIREEKKQRRRRSKQNLNYSQPQPTTTKPDWKDQIVPKEMVIAADDIEQYRGARNWRSVKRWFKEKGDA